ncbi:MAG: hypothetical protein U1F10_00535 [Burkholderiales bacterium]
MKKTTPIRFLAEVSFYTKGLETKGDEKPDELRLHFTVAGKRDNTFCYRLYWDSDNRLAWQRAYSAGQPSKDMQERADQRLARMLAKDGVVEVWSADGDNYKARLGDVIEAWAGECGMV